MEVLVRFLGKPEILINGGPVQLEQKKAQAMLLYMLFNGTCTREELSGLLWGGYPEESARRNLRNSLYKLQCTVGKELLVVKGHSLIRISPDVPVRRDVDLLVSESNVEQLLALKSFTFLEHFYVKNCPEFENWVSSMRTVYEKMLVKRLSKELERRTAKHDESCVEACANRILEIDPYHEEACRVLMKSYMSRQEYNQATSCYHKLLQRLDQDLGVKPEPETQELFQELTDLKQTMMTAEPQTADWINQPAVQTLRQEYQAFREGKPSCHCVLSGDIGMGKSESVQAFLREVNRAETITLSLHRAQSSVPYYAVDRLIELLSYWSGYRRERQRPEFAHSGTPAYFRALRELMQYMKELGRKGVLVIRNLEAIDTDSMNLFQICLWEKAPDVLLVVGEYCPNFDEKPHFLSYLTAHDSIKLLKFPCLSEEASIRYLRAWCKQASVTDLQLRKGYAETNGNLLLLREYAQNLLSGNRQPYRFSREGILVLEELLSSLNGEEFRQLELFAVLQAAEVSTIAELMQQPSVSAIKTIDALSQRGWICEQEESGHLLLKGRFGMIQRFIYQQMPRYKRVEYHRLAAEYYEQRYLDRKKDLFYLAQTSKHYQHTENREKKIRYNIYLLECILDYFDEFFPTITDEIQQTQSLLTISREEVYRRFRQYDQELQRLEGELPVQEYFELKMKLDFLQGRTMIRSGRREVGRTYVQHMMEMAQSLHRNDLFMKGCVEMLCYCVRSEDTAAMAKYIQLARSIDGFEQYGKENGVLLRIEGYLGILEGRYQEAERALWGSVDVFSQPKLRSSNYSNLAAAYDYLSLSRRRQGKYDDALDYIQRAIDLCTERKISKSLDLFYEDCGYTFFLKKEYGQAEKYFLKSIEMYERFDTYWLRSIAESCLAVIDTERGDHQSALDHFRLAEVYSRKEMAREEIEVLNMARGVLKNAHILQL